MSQITVNLNCNVNILGSSWTVRSETTDKESRLEAQNGFTDWTVKLICIQKEINGNLDDFYVYIKEVIRHEVIHAFMYESGLGDSFEHNSAGQEELMVDWFAYQIDKINDAVKEIYENAVFEGSTQHIIYG